MYRDWHRLRGLFYQVNFWLLEFAEEASDLLPGFPIWTFTNASRRLCSELSGGFSSFSHLLTVLQQESHTSSDVFRATRALTSVLRNLSYADKVVFSIEAIFENGADTVFLPSIHRSDRSLDQPSKQIGD